MRVAIAMAAVAVTVSACREKTSAAAQASDPPRIEVKAAVAPFDSVTVSSPIEGRIAEIRAAEGSLVKAGDVLFTLTNPVVERDIAHARAAVIAAERRMRAPVRSAPSNAEGIRVAAALVKQRQTRLDRLRALLASGDVAKQDVELAEAELAAAQRDLMNARATPAYDPPDTSLLQAELDRARADQTFAEHRRRQLTIAAPASGKIARLRVRVGDEIYTRDPVAEVVDSTRARVLAQIAPELVRYVRVGMAVDVKLMTIPPRRFREPVAQVIPPGAENGPAIIVQIPNADGMLQPGTPAVITMQ